jgi:uncharacterized repeat protein (TIGR02543 family)
MAAPPFSVPGKVLSKWTWDEGGLEGVWNPALPIECNIKVYGQWVAAPPTSVTVEFRDGAISNVVSVAVGSPVPKPADPVREDNEFKGWFTAPEGGTEWNFSTPVTANMVLYAQWEVEIFTVTFDPANGGAAVVIDVEKGQPSPVPKVIPTWKDHAFVGWFTALTGGTEWDFTTLIMEDTVLFAQWTAIDENSIIFDPCNGEDPIVVQYRPGEKPPVPADPTKEGFTFKGWFTAREGGEKWDPSKPLTPGMILYAQWEKEIGGWIEVEEGIIILAIVAAGLIASVGVVPLAMAGATTISTQIATANVFQQGQQNLQAQQSNNEKSGEEKNRRAVVFNPMNGRSSWSSSVMGGRQVSKPSDPKGPKGMKFSHWSETQNGTPFNFLSPINKNTQLYAVYVKKD